MTTTLFRDKLGYLKYSNAAAHSVDTGISQAMGLKGIENNIECPIYMLESTRGNVVLKMIKWLSTLVFPL